MSAPVAVRAATLTFAAGMLVILVVHASSTTGCGGTPSSAGAQSPASSPVLSATVPGTYPDPANPNGAGADSPRYFPATKAGAVFAPPPPQQPQSGKAQSK